MLAIAGIEIDHVSRAVRGNESQCRLGETAERVDDANAAAGLEIGREHVQEQCGLADTGLPNDVEVSAAGFGIKRVRHALVKAQCDAGMLVVVGQVEPRERANGCKDPSGLWGEGLIVEDDVVGWPFHSSPLGFAFAGAMRLSGLDCAATYPSDVGTLS